MLSYLTLQLARQRDHELHAAAGRYRQGVPWRWGSVRHRVGWALVTIGLALARDQAMPEASHLAASGRAPC